MKKAFWLLPFLLFLFSSHVQAQGYNPGDEVPPCVQNPYLPGCPLYFQNYQEPAPAKPQRMDTLTNDMFTTFVISQPDGPDTWSSLYTGMDNATEEDATNKALSACTAKDKNCKVLFSFRNSCAAVVSGTFKTPGDNLYLQIGLGIKEKDAQQNALNLCSTGTHGTCNIVKTVCAYGQLYQSPSPY